MYWDDWAFYTVLIRQPNPHFTNSWKDNAFRKGKERETERLTGREIAIFPLNKCLKELPQNPRCLRVSNNAADAGTLRQVIVCGGGIQPPDCDPPPISRREQNIRGVLLDHISRQCSSAPASYSIQPVAPGSHENLHNQVTACLQSTVLPGPGEGRQALISPQDLSQIWLLIGLKWF